MNAGSSAMLATFVILLKISFSFHAHMPIAKMQRPSICEKNKIIIYRSVKKKMRKYKNLLPKTTH